MGIAAGVGAQGRGIRRRLPSWCAHVDPLQRRSLTFLTAFSGCFSNQHWQKPLRIEVLETKRWIRRAFARPAAGRRDRRQMGRRPAEVDLCRRRTAETLMRAEVRVVEEAELDRRGEILRCGRPQHAQAESVLQRPPQTFDQSDKALINDRSEPLLHSEQEQLLAKDLAREAARPIRYQLSTRLSLWSESSRSVHFSTAAVDSPGRFSGTVFHRRLHLACAAEACQGGRFLQDARKGAKARCGSRPRLSCEPSRPFPASEPPQRRGSAR
jgi:hypothetical protein